MAGADCLVSSGRLATTSPSRRSTFDARTFVASGNHVVALLRLESTLIKNGRPLLNDSVHVWSFDDDGLVASYRHFNDTAQELAAWRA